MNVEPQLDMLTSRVLTAEFQAELGIVAETILPDGQFLRFRMDPGNLFERRGWLRDHLDDSYSLGISQRYKPDETLTGMAGASASIVDLPGQLKAAVEFARDRDAHLPHWLQTCRHQTPPWCEYPENELAAGEAIMTASGRAGETGTTYFLFNTPGRMVCGNNPPRDGRRIFSVTPAGDWSVHWARQTRPLPGGPQPTALATNDGKAAVQGPVRRSAQRPGRRAARGRR